MGTLLQLQIWSENRDSAGMAMRNIMDEMKRIDRRMSHYLPDSELSLLNKKATQSWVPVSRELFDLIDRSLQLSRLTSGAFDVSYASVGHHYDYIKGKAPAREQVDRLLAAVDYRQIMLEHKQRRIRFDVPGMKIDLGGIAKGYAVDRAVDILRQSGTSNAMITLGGDSRLLGDRRGRPWRMGVRHPRNRNTIIASIPVENRAISTSGDYERYFESDGVRHHHIINPRTGYAAKNSRSVTVIGPDATTTDALSTGLFVMGSNAAVRLIETLDGFEAVIIDARGRITRSSGISGK